MTDLKSLNETEKGMLCGRYLRRAGLNESQLLKLLEMGYIIAPASNGHHLARKGGLFEHSTNVTHWLTKLTEDWNIEWPRAESPFLVGMLHDLVKCRCYRAMNGADQDGEQKFEYVQPEYPGHGVASVMIAAEIGIELKPEEIAAITYHMGMFCVGKEYTDKEFNAALAKFPQQIIATHCADWWSARVTEEGVFEQQADDSKKGGSL